MNNKKKNNTKTVKYGKDSNNGNMIAVDKATEYKTDNGNNRGKEYNILNISLDKLKSIAPNKPKEYQNFLKWLCKADKGDVQTISDIAKHLNVSRQCVYDWFGQDYTKEYQETALRQQYLKARPELLTAQQQKAKGNAHMARFIEERFDNWQGSGVNHSGLTLVFNFPNNQDNMTDAVIVENDNNV